MCHILPKKFVLRVTVLRLRPCRPCDVKVDFRAPVRDVFAAIDRRDVFDIIERVERCEVRLALLVLLIFFIMSWADASKLSR